MHRHAVSSLVFTPDAKKLLSASVDDTIKVWDLETGKEVRSIPVRSGGVTVLKLSPDGKTVASGSNDGKIRIWDVNTWRLLQTLSKHTGRVTDVAFSPDGSMLASGSMDKKEFGQNRPSVVLWRVETGDVLSTVSLDQYVYSVAISPDGKLLLAGTGYLTTWAAYPGTVKLLEIQKEPSEKVTLKELRELPGHGDAVRSLQFSPDGKLLLSGCADNLIRFWEVGTWKEIPMPTRPGHAGSIQCLALSGDGKLLTSGCLHRSPKLAIWDLKTGEELRTLNPHAWGVHSLAFSPDGKLLATGAEQAGATIDGTIKLWDVGKLVGTLKQETDDSKTQEPQPAPAPARIKEPAALPGPPEVSPESVVCKGLRSQNYEIMNLELLPGIEPGVYTLSIDPPGPNDKTLTLKRDGQIVSKSIFPWRTTISRSEPFRVYLPNRLWLAIGKFGPGTMNLFGAERLLNGEQLVVQLAEPKSNSAD